MNPFQIVVVVALMALAFVFLISIFARLFRKAGPHQALIVYGFRGTRIIKGRGTVIFPMIENCRELSLELMSFDVAPTSGSVHQTGRGGHGGSRRADQSEIRS